MGNGIHCLNLTCQIWLSRIIHSISLLIILIPETLCETQHLISDISNLCVVPPDLTRGWLVCLFK